MDKCIECRHWLKVHAKDDLWGECNHMLNGIRKNAKAIIYADTPCRLTCETLHNFGCAEWEAKKRALR